MTEVGLIQVCSDSGFACEPVVMLRLLKLISPGEVTITENTIPYIAPLLELRLYRNPFFLKMIAGIWMSCARKYRWWCQPFECLQHLSDLAKENTVSFDSLIWKCLWTGRCICSFQRSCPRGILPGQRAHCWPRPRNIWEKDHRKNTEPHPSSLCATGVSQTPHIRAVSGVVLLKSLLSCSTLEKC